MSDFKRQHPVAAISRVIDLIKQNFITILILLFIGTSNTEGYFLYFLGGGLAFALIGGIFSWWVFEYRVFEDELQIKKGILVKSNVYMSKDRIQVIDITEGLLQRMFGLVKVEIKTAGGGTQSATISAISKSEAEALRSELRTKKEGLQSEEESLNSENVPYSQSSEINGRWKLSAKDLVFAAFTSGNFGLIASILGAISGQLDDFINEETIDYILEILPGYSNVTLVIALVLAIIIISWTLSFLGVIFNYSDFTISKNDKELIITTGLLERKHITVPFNRIQSVRFVEGIIRQPFGYGMIYVESAGFDQSQKGGSIVAAPFISRGEVADFLHKFLDIDYQPEVSMKASSKAKYRYLRKPNYLLLALLPLSWFLFDWGWLVAFFIPVMAWLGWLRYRDASISFNQSLLKLTYRVLARTTSITQRNRIQHIELTENPFQRRKDIYNVHVTVASGAGGMNYEVEDVDEDNAFQAYQWVLMEEQQRQDSDIPSAKVD